MHLIEYVETEMRTFDEAPLGPVDSAVLSQLAMVRVECLAPTRPIAPHELLRAERFEELLGVGLEPDLLKRLLFAVCASPRFRGLAIDGAQSVFDPKRETQFAAMTFSWAGTVRDEGGARFSYIAFRGTDASFTGWNEDFNMGWTWPVPGQAEAVCYLERIAASHEGNLFVGGHSKGGNLAVYAPAKASEAVQARVRRVYSHDGPGFRSEAVAPGRARAHRRPRPQDRSPRIRRRGAARDARRLPRRRERVGDGRRPATACSTGRSTPPQGTSPMPRSSRTRRSSGATPCTNRSRRARFEELEETVDALFRALGDSGEADVRTILAGGPKAVSVLLEAARSLDERDRATLRRAFGSLGSAAARTLGGGRAAASRDARWRLPLRPPSPAGPSPRRSGPSVTAEKLPPRSFAMTRRNTRGPIRATPRSAPSGAIPKGRPAPRGPHPRPSSFPPSARRGSPRAPPGCPPSRAPGARPSAPPRAARRRHARHCLACSKRPRTARGREAPSSGMETAQSNLTPSRLNSASLPTSRASTTRWLQ